MGLGGMKCTIGYQKELKQHKKIEAENAGLDVRNLLRGFRARAAFGGFGLIFGLGSGSLFGDSAWRHIRLAIPKKAPSG